MTSRAHHSYVGSDVPFAFAELLVIRQVQSFEDVALGCEEPNN